MLYLFDANTFIESEKKWYPIDRVPEYLDFLLAKIRQNQIGLLPIVFKEALGTQENNLNFFLKHNKKDLINLKDPESDYLMKAMHEYTWHYQAKHSNGGNYGTPLTTSEIQALDEGDVHLIAYALQCQKAKQDVCIVTMETSKPTADRQNSKIPDICKRLNLHALNLFKALKELNFTTDCSKW